MQWMIKMLDKMIKRIVLCNNYGCIHYMPLNWDDYVALKKEYSLKINEDNYFVERISHENYFAFGHCNYKDHPLIISGKRSLCAISKIDRKKEMEMRKILGEEE